MKEYTGHMWHDEEFTMAATQESKVLMSGFIDQAGGRVVNAPGDAVLAEFSSVVDAVACAMDIQRELAKRNAQPATGRRAEYRIGIHLGDVILAEDGDIFGLAVIAAVRIEGLAEPGGIAISGAVFEQIENKLGLGFRDLGPKELKGIPRPMQVHQVQLEPLLTAEQQPLSKSDPDLVPPLRPSIVVLPFKNLDGGEEQDHFSHGLTDELIFHLSRVPDLFVINRTSSFSYQGRDVTARQVGEEMGVLYVLEGGVRIVEGNQIQVTAHLVEAATARQIWVQRYLREMKNFLNLQEEIANKILIHLDIKLGAGEQASDWLWGLTNFKAYAHFIRGRGLVSNFNKEDNEEGRKEFERVIALDPNFAAGHVGAGWAHLMDAVWDWSSDPEESLQKAHELAVRSLELQSQHPHANSLQGVVMLYSNQHERALESCEKAVSLQPNGSEVNVVMALVLAYGGRPKEAVELVRKAIRHNPIYPLWYLAVLGHAHQADRNWGEACTVYEKYLNLSGYGIGTMFNLLMVYHALGREEDARAMAERVRSIKPKISWEKWVRQTMPFKDPADTEFTIGLLAGAGLL